MIAILEDDANIRKMLLYALKIEGFDVIAFSESTALYKELEILMPELLLLDIMLPGDDGFTVLSKLRKNKKTERIPVIILTAKSSEVDKLQGLNGGADDYVTKPFSIAELSARVRAVLRRSKGAYLQSIYQVSSIEVDDNKHTVRVGNQLVLLSKKEYDLLLILIKAQGNICTREQLLSEVWGENYGESRTLDVHIRKLRQKLLFAGELIETVKGVGYRLKEELDEA